MLKQPKEKGNIAARATTNTQQTEPASSCARTEDVAGDLAVAESAGGVVAREVLAVRWEVAVDQRRLDDVVVARVHDGVPEHEQRRGTRLVC
jgi:hypothetical protein